MSTLNCIVFRTPHIWSHVHMYVYIRVHVLFPLFVGVLRALFTPDHIVFHVPSVRPHVRMYTYMYDYFCN